MTDPIYDINDIFKEAGLVFKNPDPNDPRVKKAKEIEIREKKAAERLRRLGWGKKESSNEH